MYKYKSIIWFLLFVMMALILFCVSGCGTRKVELDKQRVRTSELTELVLKLQNDIRSNVRVTTVSGVKVLESIDPTKPSTYNGEKFENAKITTNTTQKDSVSNVVDKSVTNMSGRSESSKDVKQKTKDTESKRPNPWLWGAIVVIVGLVIWLKPWR